MGSIPTTASITSGTKTIQKMQIRILPYLLLLYVIAYLDRINIGFAALTMNKELAISSQQFGMLVGVFFSAISSLRYPATCCFTNLELAFGSPAF